MSATHFRARFAACVLTLILFTGGAASAVDAQSIAFGNVRTEAERAGFQILAEYAEGIGDIFLVRANKAVAGGRMTIVDLSPEVDLRAGTEDVFSGVVAKIKGNIIFGSIAEVSGLLTPCGECFFHVLTVAGGIEADGGFDNTAYVVEAGYVPWYRNRLKGAGLVSESSLAFFIQGGYKANTGAVRQPVGGIVDESEEAPDSELLRFRGEFQTAPVTLLSLDGHDIRLVGEAVGWRDLLNDAWYHRLKGALQIELLPNHYFDLSYERGSGAPSFNEGDQFSANLAISF